VLDHWSEINIVYTEVLDHWSKINIVYTEVLDHWSKINIVYTEALDHCYEFPNINLSEMSFILLTGLTILAPLLWDVRSK
jgi:hypothetical protein